MLRRYEDAIRIAAEMVAGVERDIRRNLVRISGREERYTEKFVTLLEDRLSGFSDGGVSWQVVTHVSDKQSGQEKRTGADLFIALELDFDGFHVQKGIQVQAKINKNVKYGIRFDSNSRLKKQCKQMMERSEDSYIFAYGEQTTKILNAINVYEAPINKITDLSFQTAEDFFYDFFVCRNGDRSLSATSPIGLQRLVQQLEVRTGALLKGKAVAEDFPY